MTLIQRTPEEIKRLAFEAPNLYGQVFIRAIALDWPTDAASEAASAAAKECGDNRCTTTAELDSVLDEYLRDN